MKSIHNILSVAIYESKTLLRSWFFRIFSILSLIFVVLYNIGNLTSIGMPNGDMISLPSMIPYMNLYIINIAQAIISVFLASEFLKQDKKLDTTEVIYMRSITNADYVIGKTLGNIWVFVVLNILALGTVAVFNIASPNCRFDLMPYIYYFLLICIPTLIFILGFSFFLMSIIKNQAVTFVLLLGYIAATLFYLQNQYHNLFDYMAFKLPVTYSDMIGFVNLERILTQRAIYLFLGIGFIALTILLLKRLPQSIFVRNVTKVASVTFIGGALIMAFVYIQSIRKEDQKRSTMIEMNNQFSKNKLVTVTDYDINLTHKGEQISAEATLTLKNNNPEPLANWVMTINPGLKVESVDGASFEQELQLIKIRPSSPLPSGETMKLTIRYTGGIDESICYLDLNDERKTEWLESSALKDKKHAFLLNDFLMLTPETKWYPTPGVNFASTNLSWLNQQFSSYRLTVTTGKNLQVFSQGKKSEQSGGTWLFEPEKKLPGMSVTIGEYITRSIEVDSITYSLSFFKGHNTFDPYFKILPDSLAPVIRDIKKSWEVRVRREYPYKRFQIVEIPAQFISFAHVWTGAREEVQPEMVFMAEAGFRNESANFAMFKRWASRMQRDRNEVVLPREQEENYFRRFAQSTFLETSAGQMAFNVQIGGAGNNFNRTETLNPYYIFPYYYNYVNFISSADYPIVNRVVESYLSQRTSGGGFRGFGLSGDEQGNIALQSRSFSDILSKQDNNALVKNVIQTKSGFLFALMKGAAGSEKFDDYFRDYFDRQVYTSTPIDSLNFDLEKNFKININSYLTEWYKERRLPGYIVSDVKAYNVQLDNQTKTVVNFKLTNTEAIAGAVTTTFRIGGFGGRRGGGGGMMMMGMGGFGGSSDDNIEKTVLIGANQSKEITYVLNREPRSMTFSTFASKNIPSTFSQRFDKIEINDKGESIEKEVVIPYTDGSEPSEIILDTEDPGFRIEQQVSKSLIKKIFTSAPDENELKYKTVNLWNPQVDWVLSTSEQFYGKQIRSAYFCKGGNGESKAIWSVPLKEPGYYKVYLYIPKIRMGRGRDQQQNDFYNLNVVYDDGVDHPEIESKDFESMWVEVGSYHFSNDSARIELTNKTKSRVIYADAIKLVKEK